jgi:hypothetical protein
MSKMFRKFVVVSMIAGLGLLMSAAGCSCCGDTCNSCEPCKASCNTCNTCNTCDTGCGDCANWSYSHGGK